MLSHPQTCLMVTGCPPSLQGGFNRGSGAEAVGHVRPVSGEAWIWFPVSFPTAAPVLHPSRLSKRKPPPQARFPQEGEKGTWTSESDSPGSESWGAFCRATWKQEHQSDHLCLTDLASSYFVPLQVWPSIPHRTSRQGVRLPPILFILYYLKVL